jgi:hypothetical protein
MNPRGYDISAAEYVSEIRTTANSAMEHLMHIFARTFTLVKFSADHIKSFSRSENPRAMMLFMRVFLDAGKTIFEC